jgi:hypothetical protein
MDTYTRFMKNNTVKLQQSFLNASREYALASDPADKRKWGARCEKKAEELKAAFLSVPLRLRFTLGGELSATGELEGY